MSRIICSLFFFFFANAVKAQIISGKITDKDKQAVVAFANIALKDNVDKIKFATSSDSLGNYKLKVPAGAYTLSISSLGFTSFSKKITIHADSTINVYLTPDNKTLDEIVVVAEKTTIEQQIDKKVINVGKDLLSAGGDATSILEQLAEIKIDPDGNVALRGSQNVTVLLNGKRSGLSVAELLKQIPASQIFKIEVITTPSAKYQANGLTGIINIITNKKVKAGYNASIETNANTLKGYGINSNTSYGNKIIGCKIGLNANEPFFDARAELDRQGKQPYNQNTNFEFDGSIREINAAIDWYKSSKEVVSYTIGFVNNTHNLIRDSKIFSDNTLSPQTNNSNHKHTTFDNSITYRYNFSEKSFLQLDGRISNNKNYLSSDFLNNQNMADNITDNTVTIYDFAIDHSRPLTQKISIESGYSFNQVDSKNTLTLFNNPAFNSTLFSTNREDIHALFTTTQVDMGKWEIQVGLRGEQFKRNALVKQTNNMVNLSYNNLFPSLHLIFKQSKNIQWNIGFDRRTSRPSLEQVLTTEYQSHPFLIDSGNTNLQPEFSNNFELTNQINHEKFDISSTISYRKNENTIINYTFLGSNKQTISTYKNIDGGNAVVLDLTINAKPFKWMTNTLNTNYLYTTFNTDALGYANTTGSSFALQFTNQFVISKKLSATVRYSYNAAETSIFSLDKAYTQMQLGVRYKFQIVRSNALLGLRLSDVFNTLNTKNTSYGDGFSIGFSRKPTSRVLYLTFQINLSNGKTIKKAERKSRELKSGIIG